MVIEAALAGSAEYVVSGDKDLLILKKFETVRFVPPNISGHFLRCIRALDGKTELKAN